MKINQFLMNQIFEICHLLTKNAVPPTSNKIDPLLLNKNYS